MHNGHVDTVGLGEDGANWGIEIDTYILPWATQIATGELLYSTGRSAQSPMMTERGGMERGWEGGSRGRDICIHTAD